MSARANNFTGMWIEGDDDGWRVEGVRVFDGATDDGAMSAVNSVEDTNTNDRPWLIVRHFG